MSKSLDFDVLITEQIAPPVQCIACNILATMDEAGDPNADKVRRALGNVSTPATAIQRALNILGHKVSDDAIRNHRKMHMDPK